ncbi:GNAT family N-acetyltransferase [Apilactobacillus apisilvae]|uniref:GNAT family N-acetyltransferase n=1 Tax=Apilactobacillus apisilvae TaxID=2923364 RepID=A0ABY4PK24_9LACO|nr:GNAT family N-acetyltransferase [Apilactobacillus apisilvae]UQS85647.1 GNAT family N-acetyltransferase [Apilactobacillus apisilvae]
MKNIKADLGDITINTLNPKDFNNYWEMLANSELAKKTGFEPVLDEKKAKMLFQSENQDNITVAIRITKSMKLIGIINLFPEIGENFEPVYNNLELGYFINVNYQQHGYMTKALSKTLSLIDGNTLIEATIEKENLPSMKVLQKLNFEEIDHYDGYRTFSLKI